MVCVQTDLSACAKSLHIRNVAIEHTAQIFRVLAPLGLSIVNLNFPFLQVTAWFFTGLVLEFFHNNRTTIQLALKCDPCSYCLAIGHGVLWDVRGLMVRTGIMSFIVLFSNI